MRQDQIKKIKVGSYVRIKSGKFRGVMGKVFKKEFDRRDKEYYYDVFNSNPQSSLAMVVDVREKNLKLEE